MKINDENPEHIDKDIVVFYYEKWKEKKYSIGKLNNKISEKFFHFCITEEVSSGNPILKLEDYKVIGIHVGEGGDKKGKSNPGTFIKEPIDEFIKEYNDDPKNHSLKNKKESNFEIFFTLREKIIYSVIIILFIILVVAAIILIIIFATKSKNDD